ILVAQMTARGADDPGLGGKLARLIAMVERGQQLALGEIARRAEDHEHERRNRNNTARHATVLSCKIASTSCRVGRSAPLRLQAREAALAAECSALGTVSWSTVAID